PLGTSMTVEQARQLATMHPRPIIATDADPAGRIAAERAYWLLTQHAADPRAIHLPEGTDPASLAADHGPDALLTALDTAHPLREDLISERLTNLPATEATAAAITVIAASPATTWAPATEQLDAPTDQTRQQLRDVVTAFNRDPARAATAQLEKTREVRARLQAVHADPTRRWAALANDLDPRLTTEADWPALANMFQEAHADGHDVHAITRAALAQKPLPAMPAQALRYRLVTALPTQPPINEAQRPTADPAARERASQWNFTPAGPRSTPTR
ncbi:MAG: toprim domain-containing protein, partial [Ornithinibacter sp.]